MKITDIHVGGFGVWSDLQLRGLSPRATVFYGANEAGKTTLMQFVRSVLYGYSAETRKRYFPPLGGGLQGGSLGLIDAGERMTVARISDRGPDDPGLVSWVTEEGEYSGDRPLREALGDVDEAAFNNVFSLGLDEVQELGTLSDTQAAEWLYRLTSGLDRVSLYDVIQGLRSRRGNLLGGEQSTLRQLAQRRDRLRDEIDKLVEKNRQWSRLAVREQELGAEIDGAEQLVADREHNARTFELAVGIREKWRNRARVTAELKKLGELADLPEGGVERLEELNAKIEEHRRQADVLSGQRQQLRDESRRLGINKLLVRASCRVQGLAEQRDWLGSLERRIEELETEIEEVDGRLTGERRRLAGVLGVEDPERLLDITAAEIEELQPTIDEVRSAQKELKSAQRRYEALIENERSLKTQIESAIVGGEKHGLPMDAQEASDLVANLRRRKQVEERLQDAKAREIETEHQARLLMDEQIVPLDTFNWLLVGCIFCGLVLGLWLFWPGEPFGALGGLAALVAGLGLLGAWLFKYSLEDRAASNLDTTHQELATLARQISEAEEEKQQLDTELPLSDGAVGPRLHTAEKHLAELESLMPVEAQRRRAGHEVASAEAAVRDAQRQLDEAMAAWRSQVAALGIPESIEPQRLIDAADRYNTLREVALKLENRIEEAELRRREYGTLSRRIFDLAEEVDCLLSAEEDSELEDADEQEEQAEVSPAEQLDHLLSEFRRQQADVERMGELRERAKKLRGQQKQHERILEKLERRHEGLLESCECEDEAAFRALAEDHQRAEELRERRRAITREIEAAVGGHVEAEVFAEILHPSVVGDLETNWEAALQELEEAQAELRTLVEERGAVRQAATAMTEDDTLPRRRMELGCVEKQIRDARQQWRECATVSSVLERIRAEYEENRQPETLARVSEYFDRLTGGRYVRVWTPLANDILLVEDDEGRNLPVEALSRGTREQLFLSVRLALVAVFAKHGVHLPMVLDDVLVNFDAVRARRAAEVLCDFAAAGHQLLVFTCHEHVWEIFRELKADCRRLPNRFGEEEDDEPEEPTVEDVIESIEEEPEPEPEPEPAPKKKRKRRKVRPVEVVEVEPEPEPWYDYPFVERLESEVAPAPPAELPVAADAATWEKPSDALAYIISADERVLDAPKEGRQRDPFISRLA